MKRPQEDRVEFTPSKDDVADLKVKLQKYQQIRIGGRLQTKFDQHCKTIGVVSFDDLGNTIVHNSNDYRTLSAINEKLETIKNAENEVYLETHPEEKEKLVAAFKGMSFMPKKMPIVAPEEVDDEIPF